MLQDENGMSCAVNLLHTYCEYKVDGNCILTGICHNAEQDCQHIYRDYATQKNVNIDYKVSFQLYESMRISQ